MSAPLNNLESLLRTLGQARRDGVLSASAGRYPWQATAVRESQRRASRFGWVRVAIPLAAAAAVAVLFVAPSLMKSRQVSEVAGNLAANLPSTTAQQVADAEKSRSSAATFDCDYNGDGVVDGRDIQAFLNRLQDMPGAAEKKAEYLQKCLLGN
jgi:hypothetical protein